MKPAPSPRQLRLRIERTLLAAVVLDPSSLSQVATTLASYRFVAENHQRMWGALLAARRLKQNLADSMVIATIAHRLKFCRNPQQWKEFLEGAELGKGNEHAADLLSLAKGRAS